MERLIRVKEAQQRIRNCAIPMGSEEVSIDLAVGRVLADTLIAPLSHPNFDQSAVDGYAVHFDDILHDEATTLKVVGEVAAGGFNQTETYHGEAVRIFTGAPIPDDCDTVIMQEHVSLDGDGISMYQPHIQRGENVRYKGEQIKKGEVALLKGTLLTPAAIGFIASLGIQHVQVSLQPKVGILVTGNELVSLGTPLTAGKIYESNGHMLHAALQNHMYDSEVHFSHDDKEHLKLSIQHILKRHDVVIITGGVSVGDYDFTKPALIELGFEVVLHKVAQKPGKPLLFTKNKNQFVFGLPGNPRAALVCFYEYVLPFLKGLKGENSYEPVTLHLPLVNSYKKKGDRLHFVVGKFVDQGVEVLSGQGSHMLQSFANGNVFILVPEERTEMKAGELVEVHLIP